MGGFFVKESTNNKQRRSIFKCVIAMKHSTNTLQKEYTSRKITLFYELQANRKQQQATKEHYHPGIVYYTLPCIKTCFISANLNLYFDASRLAVSQCQQCRPQELSLSPLYQNGKWFWSIFFLLLFRV